MTAFAERVGRLPPYVFADLERLQDEMTRNGVDVISLGIGDPDLPTPRLITDSLTSALTEPGANNYSSTAGEEYFREAVAEWYGKRFGVKLDHATQVCSLIGSKEGLADVGRLLLNPGDKALVPDPGYPVYSQGCTILSDGIPVTYSLIAEDRFQPNFMNMTVDDRTKLLALNYPCNPTAAVATIQTLHDAVEFCLEHNLVLCYDNAYSEISYGSYLSPSALQIDRAVDCTVEFNSCSKMFNMTGYRVGFAVGNRNIITGLKKVKAQIDSGIPKFVQRAAATALNHYFDSDFAHERERNNRILDERLHTLVGGLENSGLKAAKPQATFYLWVNVQRDGMDFVRKLMEVGVVATPGEAFGRNGRNYVRFSVTSDRVAEATQRIEKLKSA